MWLEDFIPSESWENWSKSREVSEKFKEDIKKSWAWIRRVQKDEKKAKKFDTMLASFLAQIIRNPKYDFLLDDLFKTLDKGYSSNFLLWLLSLIYLPISDKIRELSKKEQINFNYIKTFDTIDFNDNSLDENIKNRINLWIEDIIDIISIEYSSLQIKKIKELLKDKNSLSFLIFFTSLIFQFFFKELNINITSGKSYSYIEFILSQISNKINEIEVEEI